MLLKIGFDALIFFILQVVVDQKVKPDLQECIGKDEVVGDQAKVGKDAKCAQDEVEHQSDRHVGLKVCGVFRQNGNQIAQSICGDEDGEKTEKWIGGGHLNSW